MTIKVWIGVTIACIWLFLPTPALANAPPPRPPGVVFEFGNQLDEIVGAQFWGCTDQACESPVLLQQDGRCDQTVCLPGPARDQRQTDGSPFSQALTCTRTQCVSSTVDGYAGFRQFRLLVQTTQGTFLSPVVDRSYDTTLYSSQLVNGTIVPGFASDGNAPPLGYLLGAALLCSMPLIGVLLLAVGVWWLWRWNKRRAAA